MHQSMKVAFFDADTNHFNFMDLIKIDLSSKSETTIILGFMLSLIVGSYFKSALYLYMHVHKKQLPERPINILLLVQAVVQHTLAIIIISFYVIILFFDVIIADQLGGEFWCNIPWYAGVYGIAYRIVGGLVIAGYRLLLLFANHWVICKIGNKRLICILTVLSITLPGLLTQGFAIGNGPLSRKQPMWNLCIGKSEEFRTVLHEYSANRGTTTLTPEHIPKISLIIGLLFVVAELVCYVAFFGHMYRHDRGLLTKKLLKAEVIQKRNKKNAISFFGQFWTFLTEFIVLSLTIVSMGQQSDILYRVLVIILLGIEFGLVSVVEVWNRNLW